MMSRVRSSKAKRWFLRLSMGVATILALLGGWWVAWDTFQGANTTATVQELSGTRQDGAVAGYVLTFSLPDGTVCKTALKSPNLLPFSGHRVGDTVRVHYSRPHSCENISWAGESVSAPVGYVLMSLATVVMIVFGFLAVTRRVPAVQFQPLTRRDLAGVR